MKKSIAALAVLAALAAPVLAQTAAPQADPAPQSAGAPVTAIADARRGTMVTLHGVVDRITDEDEFHLSDATGWIEIDVGDDWVPVDVGETITVQGFVDDDFGPREVYARTITRADGTVLTFRRHD